MQNKLKYEQKIIGYNIFWISTLIVGVFIILCMTGGNLVDWRYLGFEVFFPFYTAIMVAEYVTVRNDIIYDVIMVNASSFFNWILRRFLYVYFICNLFVIVSMIILNYVKFNTSIFELVYIYITTSFLLSSIAVFSSTLFKNSHVSTTICGIIWIFSLLIRSMIRIPVIAKIYLFIQFADIENSILISNKTNLTILGTILWIGIYFISTKNAMKGIWGTK